MLESELASINFHDTFESLFQKRSGPSAIHLQNNSHPGEKPVTGECATSDLVPQQNEETQKKKVPEIQCKVCDKFFSNVKEFHGHLTAHSDIKLWICSICPRENFLKKSLLTQHSSVVHKNTYQKSFVCSVPQCKKFFVSSSLLQHHERLHNDERSHKCNVCGVGFFKKSYLKEHLIVHQDITSHSCKTCGKSFKELANLQSHERTHSVAKIFKCDQCTDVFNQAQLLNNHKQEKHSNIIICIQNDQINRQLETLSYDVSASSFIRNLQQIQQPHFTTEQTASTAPCEKLYPDINSPALMYNITNNINFNLKPNQIATEQGVIEGLYSSLGNFSQMKFLETSADKPKAKFDECRLFDDDDDDDEISIETEKIIEELDITIEENSPNDDIVQNYNQPYTAQETGINIINDGKNNIDILATPYNLVNFELLATLSENHIDNNEFFNVDDLNPSSFAATDTLTDSSCKGNGSAAQIENTGTNSIFFDQDLMSFLETTDIVEESAQAVHLPVAAAEHLQIATTGSLYKNAVKRPVKKQEAFKAINKANTANKSLLISNSNHTGQSNNHKNNFNNILNIKSVVTSKTIENEKILKPISDVQKVPPDNNTISEDLLKLVQKNKVQLYATNDKDTFIISINSNMEANRIEKLIKDGLLTIDINEEEVEPDKDIDNQMISPEFLDTATCDTIFKNVDRLFEDTISLAGDDCEAATSQENNFNNLIHVDNMLVKGKDNRDEVVIDAVPRVVQSMVPLKDINAAGNDPMGDETKKNSKVKDTEKKTLRKVYACKLCNKIFNKKDNYRSHMGSHEGFSQRHKCDECDQKFSWRTTLTRHKSAKHGARTVCPYCSTSYTTLSQTHQHIHEVHLQKKKFKCDFPDCGQAFFKSTYLKIHYRTHTKERPYRCRLCGATFTFSSHRLRHERIHHTPPPLHGQRIVRCSQVNFGNNNILPTQWNIKSH